MIRIITSVPSVFQAVHAQLLSDVLPEPDQTREGNLDCVHPASSSEACNPSHSLTVAVDNLTQIS